MAINPKSIEQGIKNIRKHSPMRKGVILNPHNNKWRPKGMLSSLLAQIKQEWYERVTKEAIIEMCEVMIGMDETMLKKVSDSKDSSILVRIVGTALLDGIRKGNEWRWVDMLERVLNRIHMSSWRWEWEGEWNGNMDIENVTINVITINDRKDSPWFTGVASIPQELHKSEEN